MSMKSMIRALFWIYVAFPLSAGYAWMLLMGMLHIYFGFPLFGYWASVGLMFLISWLAGSWQLRHGITKLFTDQFLIEEFINKE